MSPHNPKGTGIWDDYQVNELKVSYRWKITKDKVDYIQKVSEVIVFGPVPSSYFFLKVQEQKYQNAFQL